MRNRSFKLHSRPHRMLYSPMFPGVCGRDTCISYQTAKLYCSGPLKDDVGDGKTIASSLFTASVRVAGITYSRSKFAVWNREKNCLFAWIMSYLLTTSNLCLSGPRLPFSIVRYQRASFGILLNSLSCKYLLLVWDTVGQDINITVWRDQRIGSQNQKDLSRGELFFLDSVCCWIVAWMSRQFTVIGLRGVSYISGQLSVGLPYLFQVNYLIKPRLPSGLIWSTLFDAYASDCTTDIACSPLR